MSAKKFFLFLVLGAVMIFAVACGSNEDVASESQQGSTDSQADPVESTTQEDTKEELPAGMLDIRGSDTMVNLGQAFAEVYMDNANENGNLAVTGGGSGTGVAAMINNNVDIAQSSRSMKQEELDDAEANGATAYEFIVGQDGLAVAIHNDNPVSQLTLAQVKDIFVGKITNWADVGWADGGEITVYSRQSNSGTYVYFNENVMDGEDFAEGTMFMPGSSAIREAISQEVNAIGYIGIGYIDGINAIDVALDEDSEYYTPFDEDNVNEGLYPIARPLFFYVNGKPEGLKLHYLDWVLKSEDAKQVLRDTGFYQIGSKYQDQNKAVYAEFGLDW
ncbi:PstS family phosphate ABC transporter substrate-binding protein [Bacillaceae bacterium IKA-2]|nr:PstS family phosphate ABC transporter substrate-binding protein [Bacillaceae bacterium IKA-2]